MTYDPQTSAACPRMSPDVQFSLNIGISHLGTFRWTNPNGGQNGGQTHSQTKRRGLTRVQPVHRHGRPPSKGPGLSWDVVARWGPSMYLLGMETSSSRGLEPLLHRAIAEYLGEAGTTI